MKKLSLSLTWIVLGTAAGIGIVSSLMSQPGWAQTTTQQGSAVEDLNNNERNTDPFSRNNDNPFSMFDLIHRAQFGSNRNLNEFTTEQNQSLDSAANDFRSRQLRLLQKQQPPIPANSGENTPR